MQESLVLPEAGHCFHCGEALPKVPFFTTVLGKERAMCCLGCQLASQSIVEAGLSQYYLDRQKISRLAQVPDELQFEVYNHDEIKSKFTYNEDDYTVAELSVAGLRCAACTWLIETRLNRLDGVGRCQVNLTQARMRVLWDDDKISVGEILKTVASIGYEAHPYRQDTHEAMMKRQNKKMLIRLGVAAIGTMQAMMFSIGMYFGDYSGIATEHRQFLQYVSMIASIPVLFYAGVPFFSSAWSALRAKTVNMDIPVSIALLLTFFASSYAVFTNSGETYFDSVAMFVFFLLAGRFIEQNARLKASSMASDLVLIAPKVVKKLGQDLTLLEKYQTSEQDEFLAYLNSQNFDNLNQVIDNKDNLIHKVQAGDIVQVGAGDEILGDGILLSKSASVSQSLLTGESDLIVKNQGDKLLGGSQNDTQPLVMLVVENGENSQIALIDRLINRAMSEKPQIAKDVDKMARLFVARVLILAVIVFGVWWWFDKTQALWATVAVLVATCPCALSLATPISLAVATNRLASNQFLVTRGHTIETLSKIDVVAFDKTGTLTTGRANLTAIVPFQDEFKHNQDALLAIAGALETGSRHPIAECLKLASQSLHLPVVKELTHFAGGGVAGVIDGATYRLGNAKFALNDDDFALDYDKFGANMGAVLSVEQKQGQGGGFVPVACFYFNDVVREDTLDVIKSLQNQGLEVIMLTGDNSINADNLAQKLGIPYQKGLLPEDKVNIIKELQSEPKNKPKNKPSNKPNKQNPKEHKKVLMIGDGINDAPVLAAADVSVAMASASDLAAVSADGVLLGDTLTPVVQGQRVADKTARIIRQNLRWAFFYNTIVIIPAALGYVPPWLAAIGMSLSSLGVVLNALRIKKG
ncbi:MAG: heavy metal translocating P-type ATPase [Moraxella sp.]|nr:heavy metal translocating P-type ATPase [Moraxella sp.]